MGLMGCMGRMGRMGLTGRMGRMGFTGRMGLTDHARISKRTDSNGENPQKKELNFIFTAFSNNKI